MKTIKDLLDFLDYLRGKRIRFSLSQDRIDSVMVTFGRYGVIFEVDFFEDHIEYSYFTGTEDVESDEALLKSLIEKYD